MVKISCILSCSILTKNRSKESLRLFFTLDLDVVGLREWSWWSAVVGGAGEGERRRRLRPSPRQSRDIHSHLKDNFCEKLRMGPMTILRAFCDKQVRQPGRPPTCKVKISISFENIGGILFQDK